MTSNKVQYIKDENGKIICAVVAHEDYKDLLSVRSRLSFAEEMLKVLTEDGDLPELIDATIVHRIAEGENPVRVWREFRGLKAIELAKSAGLSAAYLSEIETGKKDGTFKTMTAIASILGIRLDDLTPPQNALEQKTKNHSYRIKAIRAHFQELGHLIHETRSFDTAAVRSKAQKVRSHIESLETDNIQEDWLMDTYETVQNILQLIDEAENNIIDTASSTREKLSVAFETHSPRAPSSETKPASSVEALFSKKRSSSAA